MSQRLAEAAVRGVSDPFTLTDTQKQTLLEEGDIAGLLELHSSLFGSTKMEDEDDDEDDEDEDDHDDDEDESDEDEDEDDDEDDESDDDKKSKGKAKVDPKDKRIQEISAEAKKYRLKNREHRNRIAELERQLAEKGSKPKSKEKDSESDDNDDKSAEEIRKEKQRSAELERRLEVQTIRNEFLADSSVKWLNPRAAFKLLDLTDVEIDEDGEVVGLDDAIKELARTDAYLVDKGQEHKETKQRRRQGATGQATGGSSSRRKGNPNRTKLEEKYPALRR